MKINIQVTNAAQEQWQNALANDFTLEGKDLRLRIEGKGCEGFTYEIGFDDKAADDTVYQWDGLKLLIDPFTAFYCQQGIIDFIFDPAQEQEGFTFENENESLYHGKFFKDGVLVPPQDLALPVDH